MKSTSEWMTPQPKRLAPYREKRPAGMSRIVWRWLLPYFREAHRRRQLEAAQ